jgi:hypothetical protein
VAGMLGSFAADRQTKPLFAIPIEIVHHICSLPYFMRPHEHTNPKPVASSSYSSSAFPSSPASLPPKSPHSPPRHLPLASNFTL